MVIAMVITIIAYTELWHKCALKLLLPRVSGLGLRVPVRLWVMIIISGILFSS